MPRPLAGLVACLVAPSDVGRQDTRSVPHHTRTFYHEVGVGVGGEVCRAEPRDAEPGISYASRRLTSRR